MAEDGQKEVPKQLEQGKPPPPTGTDDATTKEEEEQAAGADDLDEEGEVQDKEMYHYFHTRPTPDQVIYLNISHYHSNTGPHDHLDQL